MTPRPASNRWQAEGVVVAALVLVSALAGVPALFAAEPAAESTVDGQRATSTAEGVAAWQRGDRAGALGAWRRAAAAGDADAAFNLGLALLEEDSSAAEDWLARAAGHGHPLAAFALGTRLVARTPARAEALLLAAARAGYAPAQHNLARVLLAGPRAAEARAWLEAAAVTFEPSARALATLPVTTPPSTPGEHEPATGGKAQARVHTIDWVLAQPADRYTLQVAAAARVAPLERLLQRHAGAQPSAWFLHRPTAREPLSAVIGSFETLPEAERALAALAPALRSNAPWIRRFGTLHDELAERRGDVQRAEPVTTGPELSESAH